MGYTLAAVSAAIVKVAAAVGIEVSVAAVQQAIVTTAISTALSLASSFLLSPSLDVKGQKQNIRQETAGRRRSYGRVKVGGIYAFLSVREPWLYQVIMLGQGEIDGFEEHWLGDDLCTLEGNEVKIPARYQQHDKNYAQIYWRTGTPDQSAFERLVSDYAPWNVDHRLRGIACVCVAFLSPPATRFTEVFDAGLPVYNGVIRAAKVWDPRL